MTKSTSRDNRPSRGNAGWGLLAWVLFLVGLVLPFVGPFVQDFGSQAPTLAMYASPVAFALGALFALKRRSWAMVVACGILMLGYLPALELANTYVFNNTYESSSG
ncbi:MULTISPECIES: hypothetical protein [unclassified Corynebacterium]|uniref:hypothetical protein n=1 Tax=unclassified Corynebacterium TaxID=2624378 RepID=UPI00309DCF7E